MIFPFTISDHSAALKKIEVTNGSYHELNACEGHRGLLIVNLPKNLQLLIYQAFEFHTPRK